MYSHFRTVSNQASVTVEATTTVLSAGTQTGPSDIYSGQILNNDVSQSINATIQTSYNGSRWKDMVYIDLQGIGPGQSAQFSVDVAKVRFVRLVGVASGAGSVSSTVSAQLGYQTGQHGGKQR